MEVTSGTAGYSRAQRYLRFERGVRMVREGQEIEADTSTVFLQATIDEPDAIELRGNSRITGSGSTGSLQTMQARDINLDYAADGRTLEQAVLAGQSSILTGTEGRLRGPAAVRRVHRSLARARRRGHAAGEPRRRHGRTAGVGRRAARTITAATLSASGEAGQGPDRDDVRGRHRATGKPRRRAVRARRHGADAQSDNWRRAAPIDAARIPRRLHVRGRAAERDQHRRAVTRWRRACIALSSEKGAPQPHVEDERVTIDAPAIEVTLSPRAMTASGGVRTVLSAGRRQEGERGTTLLKETEAGQHHGRTSSSFDEAAGKGIYTGKAWLWQGDTSIKADTITLDDREGDLRRHRQRGRRAADCRRRPPKAPAPTSIGKAGEFQFDDSEAPGRSSPSRRSSTACRATCAPIASSCSSRRRTTRSIDSRRRARRAESLVEKREATGTQLTYQPARREVRARRIAGAIRRKLPRDDRPHFDLLQGVR